MQTLQVCPLYSCNSSPEDLQESYNVNKGINSDANLLHSLFIIDVIYIYIHLSSSRNVESKQLARMQSPSFDNTVQFTGTPKSSDISLHEWHYQHLSVSISSPFLVIHEGHKLLVLFKCNTKYNLPKIPHLPSRMSNVLTVPSTLPPIISVFVRHTDITLSRKLSIICNWEWCFL